MNIEEYVPIATPKTIAQLKLPSVFPLNIASITAAIKVVIEVSIVRLSVSFTLELISSLVNFCWCFCLLSLILSYITTESFIE